MRPSPKGGWNCGRRSCLRGDVAQPIQQKLALLDCLFAVAAADEIITSEEDNVVKQVASELKLSHDDYIAARVRYKQFLAVFKV